MFQKTFPAKISKTTHVVAKRTVSVTTNRGPADAVDVAVGEVDDPDSDPARAVLLSAVSPIGKIEVADPSGPSARALPARARRAHYRHMRTTMTISIR